MHIIQEKLLKACENTNLGSMSFREVGKLVDEEYAQKIKHHLLQLEKRGLIKWDRNKNLIEKTKLSKSFDSDLVAIPILGAASCGPASMYADENIEGYVRVSKDLLKKSKNIFIVRASGSSMNKANIHGKNVEDGDYVVINGNNRRPNSGDYVLSIIDGSANIKRFINDTENNQIVLISESSMDFPPIYISSEEYTDYMVNGEVIQIIKRPKISFNL